METENKAEKSEQFEFADHVPPEKMIFDRTHTESLIQREKVDEETVKEYFETESMNPPKKKARLDRELTKMATRLEERFNYTFDIDKALNTIWNLTKTDFISENDHITFYYSENEFPVIFDLGAEFYYVLAPRILNEEEN